MRAPRGSMNPGIPAVFLGLALGLLFILSAPVQGDEVIPRLRSFLEPSRLRRGEKARLIVEVSWPGGPTDLEFEAPRPPSIALLQLLGSRKKSLAYYREGTPRQVRQYIFTYQARERGGGELPAVALTYRRPGQEKEYSLTGEPLAVEVGAAFSPIRGRYIFMPLLAVLILAAVFFYIRWTVRRYRRRARELIEEYRRDLEEESLEDLSRARKLKVEGDMEGYLAGIEKALSGYLEKKYGLKFKGESRSEELPLPPAARAELIGIFELLKEARFGRFPEEERSRELILKKARAFLEEQKKMNKTPSPPV